MKFEKKLENISKYKELFIKNNFGIEFEEVEKQFYIKNYFYSYEIPLLEENFYEITLEIALNILKNIIQELEYFTNVKPGSIASTSDYEILNNKSKETEKYYIRFHKLYKTYVKLHLSHKQNSTEVKKYFIESFDLIKEYIDYSLKIQDELIKNLDIKLEELNKKKDKQKIEGSMYM